MLLTFFFFNIRLIRRSTVFFLSGHGNAWRPVNRLGNKAEWLKFDYTDDSCWMRLVLVNYFSIWWFSRAYRSRYIGLVFIDRNFNRFVMQKMKGVNFKCHSMFEMCDYLRCLHNILIVAYFGYNFKLFSYYTDDYISGM